MDRTKVIGWAQLDILMRIKILILPSVLLIHLVLGLVLARCQIFVFSATSQMIEINFQVLGIPSYEHLA